MKATAFGICIPAHSVADFEFCWRQLGNVQREAGVSAAMAKSPPIQQSSFRQKPRRCLFSSIVFQPATMHRIEGAVRDSCDARHDPA